MRYIRTIVAFCALFCVASCTYNYELENPMPNVTTKQECSDVVTVMGRVARFDDYDVSTRGVKYGDEGKITSMALAIFKVNDDATGVVDECEYYKYEGNQSELLFTIERGDRYEEDARYVMYVFCNMPAMANFGKGATLDALLAASFAVDGINIPKNGFPMIGSLGDTFSSKIVPDGKKFVLSPLGDDGKLTAPTIDDEVKDLLTIPMKALYAKFNFTIEVDPDQTITGKYSPQFTFQSYTVKDVPKKVDFDLTTNDLTASDVNASVDGLDYEGNIYAVGANKINFSFYLPERLLEPKKYTADNYPYPFKGAVGQFALQEDSDQNGFRDEDEKYRQRYKSLLPDDDQKATHIEIKGRFRDHQNHNFDVAYTIYLGKDNYKDFNIVRNGEYNNYITIRGIQSSNDMTDNENGIAFDHRVDIKRTQPAVISLRREVLLDSHFEVRPLRVRQSQDDEGNPIAVNGITHVKVEVLDHATTNWMRLERSYGEGTDAKGKDIYITDGVSAGKRKYFTYNLVSAKDAKGNTDTQYYPINTNTQAIVPISSATECVWIYVDECTDEGDDVRTGIIKVSYGSVDDTGKWVETNNADYPSVNYVIQQRKLFPVTYNGVEYLIEYEEEYLYNFDADADYGQTDEEGMKWGLSNTQLSYDDHYAILINKGSWGSVDTDVKEALEDYSPYYNFYLTSDIVKSDWGWKNDSEYTSLVHSRNGHTFCSEIINWVNGKVDKDGNQPNTSSSDDINVLALNEPPKSAIEYCYNKNKRNGDGQVVWSTGGSSFNTDNYNWYLPAIDEIEDIVMSKYKSTNSAGETSEYYSYARFEDFRAKFYWSCQPAYLNNFVQVERALGDRYGNYMVDNIERARATKVVYVDISGNGPSDSNNYSKVNSGSTGYEKYIDADYSLFGRLSNMEEKNVNGGETFSGSNNSTSWNITLSKSTPQQGNLHRTNDMARVRCVRKAN